MFDSFTSIFSGSPYSLKQIESHYNKKTGRISPTELTDYAFNYAKKEKEISLDDLIFLMIKKELKDLFYIKANYYPENSIINSSLSYYKEHNYKKTIDELISYMIELDKKNYYKQNFVRSFKNKYKREPKQEELTKAYSKIDKDVFEYTPSRNNDNFIFTLLSLFTINEVLESSTSYRNTSSTLDDSFLSDTFSIKDSSSYSSSDKSSSPTPVVDASGSGSGSGTGTGCSGSGSGSGSGCSGSGSGSGCGGS